MATISITIPDSKATEIRDALCLANGWNDQMGITKAAFSKKVVADYVKLVYAEYTAQQAANTARETVITTVDIN